MSNPNPLNQFDSERAREAGRKGKKKGIDTRMREFLDQAIQDGDTRTREDILREALFKFAIKGNVRAVTELFDRAYGKSKQNLELTGEDGGPVESVTLTKKDWEKIHKERLKKDDV